MVNCTLLNTAPFDVFAHMAADELFATGPEEGNFLRFFNWREKPSATFGYAQFVKSVRAQLESAGIEEYTRRPTGGGIVLHKDDLTFSLVFNSPMLENPRVIYAALHGFIKEELLQIKTGISAYESASDYRPAAGGNALSCFQNPVKDDLLNSSGDKILGGAIRRFGSRVLYQGSLQSAGVRGNALCVAAVKKAVLKYLGASAYIQRSLSTEETDKILSLAKNQYMTRQWIEKF